MAEHKVQLPDNSIITIEGPDDATDQELIDAASKHYSSKQSKPAASAESQPVTAPTVQSVTDSARHMDPMTYGAGAAAGVGVLAGAKLLKDKFFGAEKPGQSTQRIEPQMDVSQKKPSEPFLEPETTTPRGTDWESNLSQQDRELLQKSRENAAAKAQSSFPGNIAPAGANVVPQAQMPVTTQAPAPVVPPAPVVETPVNPKLPALLQPPAGAAPPPVVAPAIAEPVATPVLPTTPIKTDNPLITAAQAAPVAAVPVEAPAAKATNDKVLEAIKSTAQTSLGKPDLVTGTGMPAYQGQGAEGSKPAHKKGVFESVKQIPKEYVFVPTGQNMDIVRNAVGQPEYTKNLKSSGGYPASPQTAYEQSRNINKSLGRATMAEAKASGVALPEPTPSITQKIAGSKTVRVAGVTGALILASDLASAAQEGVTAIKEGDRQMATGYLTDILGALTGPVGFTASQLFGTSPDELRTLRAAEQARKAKTERGVAPPLASQR
tara:strand:- start:383 stop:1861 length:1479 start_codon:yes stop_codon:yes gene_type:complete